MQELGCSGAGAIGGVSDLFARHGVSRKFVYQQANKVVLRWMTLSVLNAEHGGALKLSEADVEELFAPAQEGKACGIVLRISRLVGVSALYAARPILRSKPFES